MSIAEKIARAKTDLDEVYEAGKAEGIADGKQAERDAFWDIFQKNGRRNQYTMAFSYSSDYGWQDETYNPKYPIIGQSYGLNEVFRNNSAITDTKVPLRLLTDNLKTTFHYCTSLKRIPLLVLEVVVTQMGNTFTDCRALEEINIECVNGGCIAGNGLSLAQSTKLNKPSITSIINALSTTTTGLTVTLSKTAVDTAFATAEGAADGSTSAEWLALVATRSNWTIALA